MPSPIRTARTALAGLALAAALPAAMAVDTTLDFSGAICGATGDQACSNGAQIGQSYGDIAGVLDVSHRSIVVSSNTTFEPYLKHWDSNYSNLRGVAWGGGESTSFASEMTFLAGAGQQVTLSGLSFGDYQNRNRGSSFTVSDLAGTLLFSSGAFDPGLTASIFAPNVTSAGLVLRWGPDGYDVGVDDIRLSVTATTVQPPVTPIPEPETYALMLAGLGALGAVAKRRRRPV